MDSLTQIVLGAAVAEVVGGKKLGNKAPLWGAIAGTIPDLDVFLRFFYHPIDAALVHRGFSHSILFAVLCSPIFAFLVHRIYKQKYAYKTWLWLFFFGIITHPMLDMFTNYGTQFLWPLDYRITFNTVFVVDPLYTLPFGLCVLIVLFLKPTNKWRSRINLAGVYYSSAYLIWGVVVKLFILSNSTNYFSEAKYNTENEMVTPMPLTSFYWMILGEDKENYYVGYKSIFKSFQPKDIDVIPKNQVKLDSLVWKDVNYTDKLKFISNNYYNLEFKKDTVIFYDLRFGVLSKLTNNKIRKPLMGYEIIHKENKVVEVNPNRGKNLFKFVDFDAYLNWIF
jgi:inner membrane protein